MWKPAPRSVLTTIPCKACGKPLIARRTCQHAYLHCERCQKDSEVQEHIKEMDEALEAFLEAINCDRV